MRTWWEVADEVRGGVVRAREWWIGKRDGGDKMPSRERGRVPVANVVDVQTDVGFGSRRVCRKRGK